MSEALYLYPVWLRFWHWLNALVFLVLIATGLSMHFAGPDWLLPFDQARLIHNVAGMTLTLFWVIFVIGNALGVNGKHYRVHLRSLPRELWEQSRYYLIGIFRQDPHPFHVSAERKLNALQTLSYIGVMYLLMPILILSGWAFFLSGLLPETLLGLNSVWLVAMVHLTTAWLLGLFLVVHVYIITTGTTPTTNLKAMITGWHRG